MPPKPEYWIITEEQFNETKSQIEKLSKKMFDKLEPFGFNKIESYPEWLGVVIKKAESEVLTLVSFSLFSEKPLEFELLLKQWSKKNPSETYIDIYRKCFNEIEQLERNFDGEMKSLCERLPQY